MNFIGPTFNFLILMSSYGSKEKVGLVTLEVSKLCLGSATWGEQTTPEMVGVKLTLHSPVESPIDTAEMYPTNLMRAETSGDTERIRKWPGIKGRCSELVIATKVTGEAQFRTRRSTYNSKNNKISN